MTIDDEKSVYVGGLPYDATEETVRRAFDLYGAVRDVRVRTLATPPALCCLFFGSPSAVIPILLFVIVDGLCRCVRCVSSCFDDLIPARLVRFFGRAEEFSAWYRLLDSSRKLLIYGKNAL